MSLCQFCFQTAMVSAAVGVVLGRAYSHGRNPGLKSLMDLYDYGKLVNHY